MASKSASSDSVKALSGRLGGFTRQLNMHKERGTPIPKELQSNYDNIWKEIEERKDASETEKKANKLAARKKSNPKVSSGGMGSTKSKASKGGGKMSDEEASDVSDVETLMSDGNGATPKIKTPKIKVEKEDDLFGEGEPVDPTSLASSNKSSKGADSKSGKDLVASQHTTDHGQKRGASPGTSSQTESSRGKRPKVASGGSGGGGFATDGGLLGFRPAPHQSSCVPKTLVGPDVTEGGMVNLPVVIRLNDETYRLSVRSDPKEDDICFWTEMNKRVKQLTTVLAEEHFGAITNEELSHLKVGGALMPKLLGLDGRLQYEGQIKEDRVNKADYKKFIELVSFNADTMKACYQTFRNEHSTMNPITKQKVARGLQTGLRGRVHVTTEEHGQILQAQTSFYASAIAVVRRELLAYGVAVSNLADTTKAQRRELVEIARFTHQHVAEHMPRARIDFGTAPTIASKATNTADGAENSSPDPGTTASNEGLPLEEPVSEPMLPLVVLSAVGAHACRCNECDPEYEQGINNAAREMAEKVRKETLEKEIVQDITNHLVALHWDEISGPAGEQARATMRAQILEEEVAQYKEELRGDYQKELRATMRDEIYQELKGEFNKKMSQLQLM